MLLLDITRFGANWKGHLKNQIEILLGKQDQRIVGNSSCFSGCDEGLKTEFFIRECQNILHCTRAGLIFW